MNNANPIQSDMDDIVMERRIIKYMPGCDPESIVVDNTQDGALAAARELREKYPEAKLMLVTITYGNHVWFLNADEALMNQERETLNLEP